ncbi:TorF family putative porin [Massilia sp. TS11]|uniref:TorF family putative porin n=1 Tax=Massilia sp. TS11 TaxID=2908003 RepID=UPI001EDBF738|nr:TorF family putative porin [Massilia sp. TS11]MCG2585506.1 TorF family putative porin [Massilia sp. TS11]
MTHLTQPLKLAAAVALALSTLAPLAQAEEKKPDDEVTFNASLASTYRYRGIGQTREKPALQGGADYVNNPTGFYLGTWLSTIKWIKDAGGDSNVEWDVYGGKRGELAKDITYDVGFLSYIYASNGLKPSANTTEIYGQVGFGPAYLKYSNSTTNLFGFANSKNSGYLDVGANLDVAEGLQLNLHAGRQTVKNNGAFSYNDYKVGLTKDLGFASLSGAIIGTDTDAYTGPGGKNLGKTTLVVILTKTF